MAKGRARFGESPGEDIGGQAAPVPRHEATLSEAQVDDVKKLARTMLDAHRYEMLWFLACDMALALPMSALQIECALGQMVVKGELASREGRYRAT